MVRVLKPEQVPTKPHYVILIYHCNTYSSNNTAEHWVGENYDEWKQKLKDLYLKEPTRSDIVTFEVPFIYKVSMDLMIE